MAGPYAEGRYELELVKMREEKEDYAAQVVRLKERLATSEEIMLSLEFKRDVTRDKTTIEQLEQSIVQLQQEKADLEDKNSFHQKISRRALRMVENCPGVTRDANASAFNDWKVRRAIVKGLDGIRIGLLELAEYQNRREDRNGYKDEDRDKESLEYDRPTGQERSESHRYGGRTRGEPICDGREYIMSGALPEDH